MRVGRERIGPHERTVDGKRAQIRALRSFKYLQMVISIQNAKRLEIMQNIQMMNRFCIPQILGSV